jgi:two-component system copper resistance phosphate regulon response regulator CusR
MRILLVEDDPTLARHTTQFLRRSGFAVDAAETGEDGLQLAAINAYDAVVLDLGLPGIDGREVCRRLRARDANARVVMATARDAVADRIAGLDLGADDYLVKPYALEELAARLRAVLRRPTTAVPVTLSVGDLTLDTRSRVAHRNGRAIPLTSKEFLVLEYLMRHPGEVVTREQISAHAWDDNYDPASNVIDVYIGRVRRKVEAAGEAELLHTMRGAGYRIGDA